MTINVSLQQILCKELKAFKCSHYSHDVNNDQEWSEGEDHDDHQQPFQ